MPLSDAEDEQDAAISAWLGVARNSFEEYGPHAWDTWYGFTPDERRHCSLHDNHRDAINGDVDAIALMKKFFLALVTRRLQ